MNEKLFSEIKLFARQKGYELSDGSIMEISQRLDEGVKVSAKELADILRREFGEPKKLN